MVIIFKLDGNFKKVITMFPTSKKATLTDFCGFS